MNANADAPPCDVKLVGMAAGGRGGRDDRRRRGLLSTVVFGARVAGEGREPIQTDRGQDVNDKPGHACSHEQRGQHAAPEW